jgi:hypothetical protein
MPMELRFTNQKTRIKDSIDLVEDSEVVDLFGQTSRHKE